MLLNQEGIPASALDVAEAEYVCRWICLFMSFDGVIAVHLHFLRMRSLAIPLGIPAVNLNLNLNVQCDPTPVAKYDFCREPKSRSLFGSRSLPQ